MQEAHNRGLRPGAAKVRIGRTCRSATQECAHARRWRHEEMIGRAPTLAGIVAILIDRVFGRAGIILRVVQARWRGDRRNLNGESRIASAVAGILAEFDEREGIRRAGVVQTDLWGTTKVQRRKIGGIGKQVIQRPGAVNEIANRRSLAWPALSECLRRSPIRSQESTGYMY